jgi:hypothetical protein
MTEQERSEASRRIWGEDGKSFDREMLDIYARAAYKESNDAQMEKALELSAAGWAPELHDGHTPHPFTGQVSVMSWYWRRPGKRPGKPGRLFRSTDQAYNALKR